MVMLVVLTGNYKMLSHVTIGRGSKEQHMR
jgi:hypothetical protein